MMNLNRINFWVGWLLFLVILASCTGNKMYDQLLAKADSLMNIDDDSANILKVDGKGVLEVSSTKITLLSKFGITTVYKKVK